MSSSIDTLLQMGESSSDETIILSDGIVQVMEKMLIELK